MPMQIKLIIGASIIASLLAAGWYVNHVIRENEEQAIQIEQWKANYQALDKLWKTERKAREQREKDYLKAEEENGELSDKLAEALSHEKETSSCLGSPVSDDLDKRMRDLYRETMPDAERINDTPNAIP